MAKRKKSARVRKTDTSKWSKPNPATVKRTSVYACLIIPSGKCPVELTGQDRESIREWMVKITNLKPDNTSYLPSVYKYWVRDFHESYSEEYREIGRVIDTIITEKVNKIADIGA